MKPFIISTDSTGDLPNDYVEQHNLDVHPIYYSLDGETYGGNDGLSPKEFYDAMRKGHMPTTMASNPNDIRKRFEHFIKNGFDILHISFSSALSSSYNNAVITANDLMEENKGSKIVVLDSLSASLGQGLLVHKALMLKEAGKSLDEIVTWIEENKQTICQHFTVFDLHNLHRGGRVSKTTAVIGTLIQVKPVLHVSNEGKLISLANVRGRKKSLNTLVDNMQERIIGYEDQNDIIFIGHGDSEEDARYVANQITERMGYTNFLISPISPTIGTHAGPDTIALFFTGKER